MKGLAYLAGVVLVVVGVTVGVIAAVGGWSSQSYLSPAAVLRKVGCPAQEIRTVGSWAYCWPPVNQGPTDISAMTFKADSSPTIYLRRHQAEFVGSEASVVYGPNWLVQISSTEIYEVTSEVVKATGGTIWHSTDQEALLTLCQSVTHLDRLIVHRTNANPQLHLHFPFPSLVIVTNTTSVQDAAKALCALPRMPTGVYHCPADIGLDYHLTFSTANRGFPTILVPATGCQEVSGLGPTRWTARSPAFWKALGKAMGFAKATYASFSDDDCGYC